MVFRPLLLGPLLALVASCLALAASRERRQVGEGGVDYPTYSEVPAGLSFSCQDRIPGYYADPEAQCQVWHWCVPGGQQYSFLCPNQTLFNQVYRVCDWWFRVNCPGSPDNYYINEDLYKIPNDADGQGRDLLGDESVGEVTVTDQPEQQQTEQVLQEQQIQFPEEAI